jgi:hypothetical protein
VGLITGLLTLPLAPVRGVAWLAERVLDEEEREYGGREAIIRGLAEIQAARAAGELPEAESARLEDELLEQLYADVEDE